MKCNRLFIASLLILISCSTSKQIAKSAKQNVLKDSSLLTAHVGISVYEPATGKYLYNYQGDKYFVPASNTKIPTCYAAMKYLGDSLVGLKYQENNLGIHIFPTGDPTFLHPNFEHQYVFDFFKTQGKTIWLHTDTLWKIWQEKPFGNGWSWNDYNEQYMAERSPMPIYGNLVKVELRQDSARLLSIMRNEHNLFVEPKFFRKKFFVPTPPTKNFYVERFAWSNQFELKESSHLFNRQLIPFITNNARTAFELLNDTLSNHLYDLLLQGLHEKALKEKRDYRTPERNSFKPFSMVDMSFGILANVGRIEKIHSQPTDSLLKPMMHRSDNFFAEQSLLMVSNEFLGVMNDAKIIDTILKTDFNDLPQKPRWVDGSGLSRYNLFTPQDMVAILNKMQQEFGMDRIKEIFPTGGEGTLSNYFKASQGFIFAKTGTLSGVVALSGFLYTKKNKLLIFSVLVNNHQSSATAVRRAVEKFIEGLRDIY